MKSKFNYYLSTKQKGIHFIHFINIIPILYTFIITNITLLFNNNHTANSYTISTTNHHPTNYQLSTASTNYEYHKKKGQ